MLLDLGLRPTDVVARNRERSQEVALAIFLQRRWDGIAWWSYWRPEWRIAALWGDKDDEDPFSARLRVKDVEPLDRHHPAVVLAAERLRRLFVA